jgi:hypothetical protein
MVVRSLQCHSPKGVTYLILSVYHQTYSSIRWLTSSASETPIHPNSKQNKRVLEHWSKKLAATGPANRTLLKPPEHMPFCLNHT